MGGGIFNNNKNDENHYFFLLPVLGGGPFFSWIIISSLEHATPHRLQPTLLATPHRLQHRTACNTTPPAKPPHSKSKKAKMATGSGKECTPRILVKIKKNGEISCPLIEDSNNNNTSKMMLKYHLYIYQKVCLHVITDLIRRPHSLSFITTMQGEGCVNSGMH